MEPTSPPSPSPPALDLAKTGHAFTTIFSSYKQKGLKPSKEELHKWVDEMDARGVWKHIGHRDLVMFLYYLSYFDHRPPPIFILNWFHHATPMLGYFRAKDLSLSMYCMAKLQLRKTPVLESFVQTWIHHAYVKLYTFNCQDLSNSLYGINKLRVVSMPTVQTFLQAWFLVAMKRLPFFQSKELSCSMLSLSQLNIGPAFPYRNAFVELWIHIAFPQLRYFNQRSLVASLFALAHLPPSPFPAVSYEYLVHCTTEKMDDTYDSQSLMDIMFSFMKFQKILPPPLLRESLTKWFSIATTALDRFTTDHLVYAISNLHFVEDPKVYDRYLEQWMSVIKPRIQQLNAKRLFHCGLSLSKLSSSILLDLDFVELWLECVSGHLQSEYAITTSIYCLSKLRLPSSSSFLDRFIQDHWLPAAIDHVSQCTPPQLANIIWSLGHVRPHASPEHQQQFLEVWFETTTKSLSQFNVLDLSNAIYGITRLVSIIPSSFVEVWLQVALPKLSLFNASNLAYSLSGISKIEIPPMSLMTQFLQNWLQYASQFTFIDHEMMMVRDALKQMKIAKICS
jgi:hypothetical protein